MKAVLVALFCLTCYFAVAFSEEAQPLKSDFDVVPQAALHPTHDDFLNDYKRFKRENEASSDPVPIPPTAIARFQQFITNWKEQCGTEMGFSQNEIEKSLLFEENPSQKEKCLMACVLDHTNIMDENNKVNVDTIGNIAGMIADNNELIIAIAKATAANCNRSINPEDKCEAAGQINRCIAQALKTHKTPIVY